MIGRRDASSRRRSPTLPASSAAGSLLIMPNTRPRGPGASTHGSRRSSAPQPALTVRTQGLSAEPIRLQPPAPRRRWRASIDQRFGSPAMSRNPASLAAILILLMTSSAFAQNPVTDGSLLIHGNYCGPGNRGYDKVPVDALDAACRHHDLCTPDNGLPSCACNARLSREAGRVARSRRQPNDLRQLATIVANAATIPICQP